MMLTFLKNIIWKHRQYGRVLTAIFILATLLLTPSVALADFTTALGGAGIGAGLFYLGCGVTAVFTLGTSLLACGTVLAAAAVGGGLVIGGLAGDIILANVLNGLFSIVAQIATWIVPLFIHLSAQLLNVSILYTTRSLINFPPVLQANALITQLANMVLVALFVIIALATIAGIESYGVRKVLPMLIVLAVIVNFSTVMLGVVLDSGNTLLNFMWNNSNLSDISLSDYIIRNMKITEFIGSDSDAIKTLLANSSLANSSAAAINASLRIVVIVVGFFAGYVFLRLALLLFLRIGMIWFLIITAPLVFIAAALPAGPGYMKEWWKQLLSYSFVGPIVFFFIFIGLIIWTTLNAYMLNDPIGKDTSSFALLYITPIVLFFFMQALNISKKMAGAAANAIVDGAINIGKGVTLGGLALAGGAVVAGAGRKLLTQPFVKKTYQKLQQSQSRTAQRVGQRLEGAHIEAVQAREKAAKGSYSGIDALSNEDIIRRVRENSLTPEQIVMGARILEERKQTLPSDVAARALKLAPSISRETESKLKRAVPNVRYYNEKYDKTGNIDIASAYNFMKTQRIRAINLAPEALENPATAALLDMKQLYEVARSGTPQQLAALSKGFEELAKQDNMQLEIASALGKDRVEFQKSIGEIVKKIREEAIFKTGAMGDLGNTNEYWGDGGNTTT